MKNQINALLQSMDDFNADYKALQILLSDMETNELLIVDQFTTLFNKYPAHPILVAEYCMFLQLTDVPEVYSTYNLKDVKAIFAKACEVYPDDILLHIEHAYHILNIDDNEEGANKYLDAFRKRVHALIDIKLEADED